MSRNLGIGLLRPALSAAVALCIWVLGDRILPGARGESGPPARTAASDGSAAILDQSSFWRFHIALRKPVVPAGAMSGAGRPAAAPVVLPVHVDYRSYPNIQHLETGPAPADWAGPDFDDGDWPRGRVAQGPDSLWRPAFSPGVEFSTGTVCMRGKFAVADPAAVRNLSVTLTYRGGVVVFLNGREVARQDLPAGRLDSSAPGGAYPAELFGPVRRQSGSDAGGQPDPRDRRLGPVALPADLLRKGVNVLAIELHRSDYQPPALGSEFMKQGWVPIGLSEVRLAGGGTGVTANLARPPGFRVWTQDVNDRVSALDYGDPNEPLRPVELVGARNGVFSGQVVVGSTEPIRDLKVVAGELKTPAGSALPASCVQVRYGHRDGQAYGMPRWFDGLRGSPPVEVPVEPAGGGAVLPVWVTVRVPADAAPGEYRGTLTISARGVRPVEAPVRLGVAGWTLPDPRSFRTYVGIYQSPTTLALHYNVPEWSEQHWKLMDRSFQLLAQVGNRIVNIPVVDRTQFGNDEGMVYWVRRADGGFDYDFTVFDRYMELVVKHLGTVDFVALQVWHSGGWETRKADQENTVTVIDKATGRREHMQVPVFGTEDSKRFFKPVLDAIRQRLARHGLDKAMCIGILSDGTAPPEVFKAFDEIIPGGANWTRGCHSVCRSEAPYYVLNRQNSGRVVLHEFCYGMALADPDKGLPPIWKQRNWPGTAYIRHNFDDTLSLLKYRTFAERALYCGTRGIGRTCLDYWDCVKGERGRPTRLFNRFRHSSCSQREPNMWRLAWPGPDGAEPTVRFQNLLEGIQTAEAMIVVAEASGERADRLGPELTARCRRLFVDRLNYARRRCPEHYGQVYLRTYHHEWKELDERLFSLAAEVTARLTAK